MGEESRDSGGSSSSGGIDSRESRKREDEDKEGEEEVSKRRRQLSEEEKEQRREDTETREWANKEEKKRKEESRLRREGQGSEEEESLAKRVKVGQEYELTEGDKQLQEDIFGPAEHENKRKDEGEDQVAPEVERRRTREEKDWYDDFWTDEDRTDRNIGLIERYEIEDK
eukprot:1471839-Karenia_brevis.AAC.1